MMTVKNISFQFILQNWIRSVIIIVHSSHYNNRIIILSWWKLFIDCNQTLYYITKKTIIYTYSVHYSSYIDNWYDKKYAFSSLLTPQAAVVITIQRVKCKSIYLRLLEYVFELCSFKSTFCLQLFFTL